MIFRLKMLNIFFRAEHFYSHKSENSIRNYQSFITISKVKHSIKQCFFHTVVRRILSHTLFPIHSRKYDLYKLLVHVLHICLPNTIFSYTPHTLFFFRSTSSSASTVTPIIFDQWSTLRPIHDRCKPYNSFVQISIVSFWHLFYIVSIVLTATPFYHTTLLCRSHSHHPATPNSTSHIFYNIIISHHCEPKYSDFSVRFIFYNFTYWSR